MLCLYVEAPFAACRTFTAGWYRPTATFLTPSAAYGLLLNVAGIESRLREEDEGHDGKVPASLTAAGPAAGARWPWACRGRRRRRRIPRVQTVYQQLHNYPVGTSGQRPGRVGARATSTTSRRFAANSSSSLRAVIALDGNADLEDRVRRGLAANSTPAATACRSSATTPSCSTVWKSCRPLPEAHWYERRHRSDRRRPPATDHTR